MRDELDIPMPRMAPAATPSYRVALSSSRVDVATKRLAVAAVAIGGALLMLVGVWSMGERHDGGVPVVEADSRPWRTKPDQPGGMQVAGENETILSGATTGTDAMAPAPEIPAPQALTAEADPAPAKRAAAPAPAPVAAAPTPAATEPTPETPLPETPLPETPAVAAALAKPAVPAAPGAAMVQLAALGSEQAAMQEWQRLAHKLPALLGDKRPAVQRADRDGKTFYRLRTGGFADMAQATAFCGQMRAHGAGCALGRF